MVDTTSRRPRPPPPAPCRRSDGWPLGTPRSPRHRRPRAGGAWLATTPAVRRPATAGPVPAERWLATTPRGRARPATAGPVPAEQWLATTPAPCAVVANRLSAGTGPAEQSELPSQETKNDLTPHQRFAGNPRVFHGTRSVPDTIPRRRPASIDNNRPAEQPPAENRRGWMEISELSKNKPFPGMRRADSGISPIKPCFHSADEAVQPRVHARQLFRHCPRPCRAGLRSSLAQASSLRMDIIPASQHFAGIAVKIAVMIFVGKLPP